MYYRILLLCLGKMKARFQFSLCSFCFLGILNFFFGNQIMLFLFNINLSACLTCREPDGIRALCYGREECSCQIHSISSSSCLPYSCIFSLTITWLRPTILDPCLILITMCVSWLILISSGLNSSLCVHSPLVLMVWVLKLNSRIKLHINLCERGQGLDYTLLYIHNWEVSLTQQVRKR
jgi:hypothetical protein